MTEILIFSANYFKLPSMLLLALCSTESDLRSIVTPFDGGSPSFGVCQIKHSTAQMMGYKGAPRTLLDPTVNAMYAGKYLRHLVKRYNGNICHAISAYNMGKVKRFKSGRYRNISYVRKVLGRWYELQNYGKRSRRDKGYSDWLLSRYGEAHSSKDSICSITRVFRKKGFSA